MHFLASRLARGEAQRADEGSKTFVRKHEANDEIGLVPLVISISQVLKGLKAAGKGQPAEVAISPEAALADLVAGGGLCSWYIATCQVTPPSDDVGAPAAADDSVTRAMLQQAFDMRAMLIILDLGDAAAASDPGWSLSRFVHNELLHSGNRLLAIGRPEDVSQGVLEALDHGCMTLELKSLGLDLQNVGLADIDGARFVSALTGGSVFSSDVTALFLGGNAQLGVECGKMMAEMLKMSGCALRWLDIRSTSIDGRSLAFAIKVNPTLTYLDVRETPRWDDTVFYAVGSTLLDKGCTSQLRYLRCDSFDVLPSVDALELPERALGLGVVHALAAVIRRNDELRTLDLTATDVDTRGALALAMALESNTSLTRLILKYNHLDDTAQATLRDAAGPLLKLSL